MLDPKFDLEVFFAQVEHSKNDLYEAMGRVIAQIDHLKSFLQQQKLSRTTEERILMSENIENINEVT